MLEENWPFKNGELTAANVVVQCGVMASVARDVQEKVNKGEKAKKKKRGQRGRGKKMLSTVGIAANQTLTTKAFLNFFEVNVDVIEKVMDQVEANLSGEK